MSIATVKQFWQKAQADKALQAKLAAIPETERQATVAAIVKVAAEAGFVFTAQEYDAAVKDKVAKGELSEADLDRVSGGIIAILIGFSPPQSPPSPPGVPIPYPNTNRE